MQLIASLPYVMITGAIMCLLAASAHHVPAGGGQTNPNTVPASIVATYIGTVLALLMTSSFVMYVIKIIDRRSEEVADQAVRRASWKVGWEFLLIPVVLVGALVYAMVHIDAVQGVWAPIAIFMLLSCLAVAHGVVYRGIFYDIDRLERDRDKCLRTIAEARSITEPDLEDTYAISEAREALKKAKEDRDRIDSLQFPGLYVDNGNSDAWYRRFLGGQRSAPPSVPFDISLAILTDAEAAPDEHRQSLDLAAEINETEREMVRTSSSLEVADLPRLANQRAEIENRLTQLVARREALEFQHHRASWELNSRIETLMIDLRAAFDVAKTVEPAVTRIAAEARNG